MQVESEVKEIMNELEEYISRGFPPEIALAKVLAHAKAKGVPGVWRVILKTIEKEKELRTKIIESVPEYVREEVKELLACTREIRTMKLGKVDWGWFKVEEQGFGEYLISSVNSSLPGIIAPSGIEVQRLNKFKAIIKMQKGKIAMLRTGSSLEAKFEIIGLITYCDAFLLEVRLSERGEEAIYALQQKILNS